MIALVLAAMPCQSYGDAVRWPAPVLPAALAARYPSGAATRITAHVDSAGRPVSIKTDFSDPVLRNVAVAWANRVTYEPPREKCKNVSGPVILDMRFFPPSNGVAALPAIVNGVNFDELTYRPGPCYNSESAPMHNGGYSYFSKQAQTDIDASVDDVFSGRVNGAEIAVVVLRCEFPVGFNAEARAYKLNGTRAQFLAKLGSFVLPAPDDPYVEGGWIHVNFVNGLLYVDTWDYFKNCDAKRDWEISTYALRGANLVKTYAGRHHRNSVAVACEQ